ncbi:MFS transporter/fungal specific transcription factor domain-containing protein [Aspergillus undulatus]|uniref:MFS transporter/fungal specific transcription factor domain-containing protein n=1 Tax=Aspergillus undulatus TaxID=1810928 RepID=UPI003CCCB1BA
MGGGKPMPPPLPDSKHYVVDFDGPDDPAHPFNWSFANKVYISSIVCFGTLTASFTSAIFAPGTEGASKAFDVGSEVGTLGTTLYVLGFAFGPVIWAPASELIGRRWPLTIGMLGGAIFTIASAVAKDIQTLAICRFFAGTFGASQLSVVPAVLSDIWDSRHRGDVMALYALTVFVGPFIAPSIGGFIATSYLGWRWTLYIPAFISFASGILLLISLKETYAPLLLISKAAALRKRTSNWGIHAKHEELEVKFGELLRKYFTRPLQMLITEPILLLISIYMSFIYGIVYALVSAYPYIFETVHGMAPGIAGLAFIGLIIGAFLAVGFIIFQHAGYAKKVAANGNVPVPEWRLSSTAVGAPVFAIGIFWFAWTGCTPSIHWMAPMAAGVTIGFGILSIFFPCFIYIVDTYLPLAASAVAANIILRSTVAAGFPLFSKQMFANLGVQWAGTLLGCLAVVMVPIPFAFQKYGPWLRGKSKLVPNWGYKCSYPATRSTKNRASAAFAEPSPALAGPSPTGSGGGVTRSLSANSGAAFVRKIGLKVDPMNAPRLNLFGWNLGARHLPSGLAMAASALPIVNIITQEEMTQLAEVYFTKVDPCYGFLDKETLFERLNARWLATGASSIYDSVLAGVGALGLLFSERTAKVTELLLHECSKSLLDSYDAFTAPSTDLVTGWLLRVVYMRMTAPPYSAWLASSTLMHLIEAAGLHHEAYDGIAGASNANCGVDIRRRLIGMAVHQNMWSSYDLGLSRVSLKVDLSLPVAPRPGDVTVELLELLPISASLDPEETHDDSDLQWSLVQTLDRVHTRPPSVMAQTNVVLCILRRLQLLNMNTSPAIADRVLELFQKALQSAQSMLADCSPWHHAANVPFHIITILLEMDTCASLALLPAAMETIKLAASTYNTATMREAYATARLLVFLYQQRRCHDARLLRNVLDGDNQQGPGTAGSGSGSGSGSKTPAPNGSTHLEDMPLLEELVADMPSLQGFDFEQFLDMDMLRSAQGMDVRSPDSNAFE